mmetsp:Transcript_10721/g.27853  ORF Transcript_10721/g.27853 Transcript_10721/m.27853 type:complete len:390 (-) Transcript_10721:870-2039(-)
MSSCSVYGIQGDGALSCSLRRWSGPRLLSGLEVVVVFLGEAFNVFRRPVRHFHAEVQAKTGENFLDLVQGFAAEIRCAQHLCFGLLDEVTNVNNVVVLQAVCRANRQFKFVDFLEQDRVEAEIGFFCLCARFHGRLFEVDEQLQLILQDTRGIGHGIFRRDRPVCLDVEGQFVIVENSTLTGVFDLIANAADRAVNRVNRNITDWGIFRTVRLGRDIALAGRNGEFHAHFSAIIQSTDHEIRVQDLGVTGGFDLAGFDFARTFRLQHHALWRVALHEDRNLLQVQHDRRDVFANTLDRREFVNDIVDLNADDRSTLQGRQQNATQRVAESRTIATLQRLNDELGFALGIVSGLDDRTVRADQHFPVTVVDVGGFDVCHGRRILRMGQAT